MISKILMNHHFRPPKRWVGIRRILLLVFIFIITLGHTLCVLASFNPYQILGVPENAGQDQIKRAYRDLAKKLHPDKNSHEEHETSGKFIELNKAFDILKDPSRRARYDRSGETEENRHSRAHHRANRYNHQYRQAHGDWSFGNGYATFTLSTSSRFQLLRRHSITIKQYYNEYMAESKRRPFLIFVYRELCPSCTTVESTWMKIVDELRSYNVGFVSINYDQEHKLSRDIGVTSVPYIACLLNQQVYPYNHNELSLPYLVKFIKNILPKNLVSSLQTEHDQERFIVHGPTHNRLSAIIINNENSPRLRYLLLAFELRQYYRFGHISTKLDSSRILMDRYALRSDSASHILVFDENIKQPTKNVEFQSETYNASEVRQVLLKWPFLKLPRISSQSKFDDLCGHSGPSYRAKNRDRLCSVLLTSTSPSSEIIRSKMIEFIHLNNLESDDRVVFAYLDPDRQKSFVEALIRGTNDEQPAFVTKSIQSSIIMIERHATHARKATYKWLSHRWTSGDPDELDKAKLELHHHLVSYTQGSFRPSSKVLLEPLSDEEEPGLLERLVARLLTYSNRLMDYGTSSESLFALVILLGIACLTSLFLYKSVGIRPSLDQDSDEEGYFGNFDHFRFEKSSKLAQSKNETYKSRVNGTSPSFLDSESEFRLIELRAQTYNGMVRSLKPGYRSIVLLTDEESKGRLLLDFKKAVWPYRRNKTLLFGYLCLDKNLEWYKTLLEQVLGVEGLRMNKKNCIGTVISLNGFKRYMRVYHSKHHDIDYYDDETENDGSFLGFDENGSQKMDHLELESEGKDIITPSSRDSDPPDDLLGKLPIWLDKMFDGLTKRYFVHSWPDNIK